jgi:DNA-binding transcriptional ArsR family regulator
MLEATTKTKRTRGVEAAVSFAVAHRVRIEILCFLNEGAKSPEELARLIHQPLSKVGYHVKELLDAGSIEIAKTEPVRNVTQYYYRAIEMACMDEKDWAAMSPEEKQETTGVILQAIMAEALSSLWAGKFVEDPRPMLSWRWFNVDEQGRNAIADEQERSWARVQQIEAESNGRRIDSGEEATSIIVTSLGYERTRTVAPAQGSPPG